MLRARIGLAGRAWQDYVVSDHEMTSFIQECWDDDTTHTIILTRADKVVYDVYRNPDGSTIEFHKDRHSVDWEAIDALPLPGPRPGPWPG